MILVLICHWSTPDEGQHCYVFLPLHRKPSNLILWMISQSNPKITFKFLVNMLKSQCNMVIKLDLNSFFFAKLIASPYVNYLRYVTSLVFDRREAALPFCQSVAPSLECFKAVTQARALIAWRANMEKLSVHSTACCYPASFLKKLYGQEPLHHHSQKREYRKRYSIRFRYQCLVNRRKQRTSKQADNTRTRIFW